jgi:serine/threonine protein kinase, bacterial
MATTDVAEPREKNGAGPPEAVIREARRRQRLRWTAGALVAVALAVVGLVLSVLVPGSDGGSKAGRSKPPARSGHTTALPSLQPERPQSLALGPHGSLYVADTVRNQILERLPDGRFTVVVGDGRAGFSGDGGPATAAEIDDPGGMAVASNGTLYFSDTLNDRIRAVSPTGTISTIAGDGQLGNGNVSDGTPALDAAISPSDVIVGPDAALYVTTEQQVLRLGSGGTFTCLAGCSHIPYVGVNGAGGPAVDGSPDGPNGLAFDGAGDLFIAGFYTKEILMIDPQGILHDIGSVYPRGPGGLVTGPGGTVYAMDELGLVQLSPTGIRSTFTFPGGYKAKVLFHGINGFSPDGIAIDSSGSIFVDTYYGNGYATESAIAVVRPNGTSALLWHAKPG